MDLNRLILLFFIGNIFQKCSSQAVKSITYDQFSKAVTTNPPDSNSKWPKPSKAKYDSFINSAGPKGKIANKEEAAMALANILQESDGLQAKREIECEKTNCPNKYNKHGCEVKGQYYYGRGYIQLTWCYNYKAASKELLGDENILLKNPDRVAKEDKLSWDTTFWFWKTNVHQEATTGKFGATIKKINGRQECGPNAPYPQKAERRKNIYKNVRKAFGLQGNGNLSGC